MSEQSVTMSTRSQINQEIAPLVLCCAVSSVHLSEEDEWSFVGGTPSTEIVFTAMCLWDYCNGPKPSVK